jgi:hypothetical protein
MPDALQGKRQRQDDRIRMGASPLERMVRESSVKHFKPSSSALGALYRRMGARVDKPHANTADAHKLNCLNTALRAEQTREPEHEHQI